MASILMMLITGALQGAWRIGAKIAQGGWATVHPAALKDDEVEEGREMFVCKMSSDEKNDECLDNETEVMFRVQQRVPFTTRVVDHGKTEEGRSVVFLERCAGDLLFAYGRAMDKDPLSEEILKKFLVRTCVSLFYLHRYSYIHGDIKLSNFLVKDMESMDTVLSDFGLMYDIKVPDYWQDDFRGTPSMAAPERLAKDEQFDSQSDMWAVGMCLYQLMTGDEVVDDHLNARVEEYIRMVLSPDTPQYEDEYPAIDDLRHTLVDWAKYSKPCLYPGYSEDFSKLVNSLLRVGPNDRPSARRVLDHACVRDMVIQELVKMHQEHPHLPLPNINRETLAAVAAALGQQAGTDEAAMAAATLEAPGDAAPVPAAATEASAAATPVQAQQAEDPSSGSTSAPAEPARPVIRGTATLALTASQPVVLKPAAAAKPASRAASEQARPVTRGTVEPAPAASKPVVRMPAAAAKPVSRTASEPARPATRSTAAAAPAASKPVVLKPAAPAKPASRTASEQARPVTRGTAATAPVTSKPMVRMPAAAAKPASRTASEQARPATRGTAATAPVTSKPMVRMPAAAAKPASRTASEQPRPVTRGTAATAQAASKPMVQMPAASAKPVARSRATPTAAVPKAAVALSPEPLSPVSLRSGALALSCGTSSNGSELLETLSTGSLIEWAGVPSSSGGSSDSGSDLGSSHQLCVPVSTELRPATAHSSKAEEPGPRPRALAVPSATLGRVKGMEAWLKRHGKGQAAAGGSPTSKLPMWRR